MASASAGPAGPLIQALFDVGSAAGLADRALIERFLRRDGTSESAFAGLVERHGPMVVRVCRDVLRDEHDADDAFQAVFLVLARRAGSVRDRESLGAWLYGVALRVARCARRGAGRRREVERRGAGMRTEGESAGVDRLDAMPVLHDEVGRLPENDRAAVVLCYFEGLTHEEAAGQLGWPVGTVRSRLARARDRLRSRLTRRGLAPSAAFLGVSAASGANSATVPSALAAAAVGAAMRAAEAGAVPAAVAALAGRTLRDMTVTKLKWIATGLAATGLVASAGVGLVAGGQGVGRVVPEVRTTEKPSRPVAEGEPRPASTQSLPPPSPRSEAPPAVVGAAADPPQVLWVRFKNAHDRAIQTRRLFERGAASMAEYLEVREALDVAAAQLEARRDELQDQLELLKVQLAIREADVAAAKAQLEKTAAIFENHQGLARSQLVGDLMLNGAKQDVSIRTAERDKRQAEADEVRLRIVQTTRQHKLAESLWTQANALLSKSAAPAAGPNGPEPPGPK